MGLFCVMLGIGWRGGLDFKLKLLYDTYHIIIWGFWTLYLTLYSFVIF